MSPTNLATNPKAGLLNTTDWVNDGLATFEAVTFGQAGAPAASREMKQRGLYTGFHAVADDHGDGAYDIVPVEDTEPYRMSAYVYVVADDGGRVELAVKNDAGTVLKQQSPGLGTPGVWTRLDTPVVADETDDWRFGVRYMARWARRVYVANDAAHNLSIYETAAGFAHQKDIGTTGSTARHVAVRSDETRVYVVDQGGGKLVVLDPDTNTVKATITVGGTPLWVALSPSQLRAWVTDNAGTSMSEIDIDPASGTVNTVLATFSVGATTHAVAFLPDGSKAYATNNAGGTVKVVTVATKAVAATVTVGTSPRGVAVTPDGTKVYVANGTSNNVSVITAASDTVTATVALGAGRGPRYLAVTPNGLEVWVGNHTLNTVSVISTTTDTVIATVTLPAASQPSGLAFTPDGLTAYVTNYTANAVSVIDVATRTLGTPIVAGNEPQGIAISPDPAAEFYWSGLLVEEE